MEHDYERLKKEHSELLTKYNLLKRKMRQFILNLLKRNNY